MPISQKHSEQARINGAKSKGPTSPEGKAKSSRNAIKHGFAAVINVVLCVEDKPAFDAHVQGFRNSFKPKDYAEQSLVDQLAAIHWRHSRLVGLETALIDAQVEIQDISMREEYPNGSNDGYFRLIKAWQALAHPPAKQATEPDPTVP